VPLAAAERAAAVRTTTVSGAAATQVTRPAAAAGAMLAPVGAAQEATERALASAAAKQAEAEPAPIRIEIGRVDVRAAPPPAAPHGPRPRRAPRLTLERYLRQGGRR